MNPFLKPSAQRTKNISLSCDSLHKLDFESEFCSPSDANIQKHTNTRINHVPFHPKLSQVNSPPSKSPQHLSQQRPLKRRMHIDFYSSTTSPSLFHHFCSKTQAAPAPSPPISFLCHDNDRHLSKKKHLDSLQNKNNSKQLPPSMLSMLKKASHLSSSSSSSSISSLSTTFSRSVSTVSSLTEDDSIHSNNAATPNTKMPFVICCSNNKNQK